MKNYLVRLALVMALVLAAAGLASATTLTFEDSGNLGVTLGGNMTWNGGGGGHLYCNNYMFDNFIYFATPTTVNNFQMNALPWEDYGSPSFGPMNIAAFDAGNNQLWSTTVNLITPYTDWAHWLTVNVNTENVASMTFYGPGHPLFPSIDNMVINEAVPIPGAVWLLGSGLLGLAGWRKKFRK